MENLDKQRYRENDLEMGSVLIIFLRVFRSIRYGVVSLFSAIGKVLLFLLLFLKRYAVFFIIALVGGFALGTFLTWRNGSKYQSRMTVRANFGSARALYNSVDYINALVSENNIAELSSILALNQQQSRYLSNLEIIPVTDELYITELYKNQFLNQSRRSDYRTDTFWTRTMEYKEFKDNLSKFDYPLHEIIATSTKADIFPTLEKGILGLVDKNRILKANLEISKATQREEDKILLSSIQGLDTLREVYNERLRQPAGRGEASSTTVNLNNPTAIKETPELELYEKMLLLKDELNIARMNAFNKQEILQVYASFSPVGKRLSLLRQQGFTYAYFLFFATAAVLLLLELYKWLGKRERAILDGSGVS